MTILYKPVLIESAEQAEALPLGAPVWRIRPHAFTDDRGYVDTTFGNRMVDTDTGRHFAADMVGWTALVPIEAEEETQGITTWPRPDNAPWPKHSDLCGNSDGEYYYREDDGTAHDITEGMTAWLAAQPVRTRLVTPWEEA